MEKYCEHKFLIPPELLRSQGKKSSAALTSARKVSPFCLGCWNDPQIADNLKALRYERPETEDPVSLGFCDLIFYVVKQRGWFRDADGAEDLQNELRFHLLAKRSAIEPVLADLTRTDAEKRAYIRTTLENHLQDTQTASEGKVVAGSESLEEFQVTAEQLKESKGGHIHTHTKDQKQGGNESASDCLTDLTGGDPAGRYDDRSFERLSDRKSEPKKEPTGQELLTAELKKNFSIITDLRGRKDGVQPRPSSLLREMNKQLSAMPTNEREAFSALYLDREGELLERFRTYREAQTLLGLSVQELRTLERLAIGKLKPYLSPAFFKRRAL
jgi:hypothetical protein